MAIYRNRMKFSGDPGSGSNILVKYGDKQEYDEVVLNEALADLETKIKDGGVLYVETLPTGEDITNSVYGMEHIISSTDTKNSLTDVIGSYMHLDGSYYVPNTGATIVSTKYGAITTVEEIDTLHYKINNDTVVFKFDTSDTYTITISETHIDYYIGNKEEQTIKQIATLENVSDEYIHKSEKGTAGGIATLDSDGKLPVSQLPTGSEIYLGTYDASTGVYPESEGLVSGCYYRISVAGTIDGVSYNINDKLCWNGTVWQKIVQTESVTSVNEKKGEVVLTGEDINATINNTTTDTINNLLTNNVLCTDNREQSVKGTKHFNIIRGYSDGDNENLELSAYGEEGCRIGLNGKSGIVSLGGTEVKANNKNVVTKAWGAEANINGEIYKDNLTIQCNTDSDVISYFGSGKPSKDMFDAITDTAYSALTSNSKGAYMCCKGDESGGILINGDTMVIYNPGDDGYIKVYNEDDLNSSTTTPTPKATLNSDGKWNASLKADQANLLQPTYTENLTTTRSTWNASKDGKIVFGQAWKDTSLSQDTGDFSIFLTGNSSITEANMCIDGSIYANGGSKVVTEGSFSSLLPSGNVTGSLSGTTLTLYIK